MKNCVCAIALMLSLNTVAAESSPDETELRKQIETLLIKTESFEMGNELLARLISIEAEHRPNIPKEVWDLVAELMDVKDLMPEMVDLYAKHFTLEEIVGINAFYDSPLGQKLIETQPLILHESMTMGELWAKRMLLRLAEILKEQGYQGQKEV